MDAMSFITFFFIIVFITYGCHDIVEGGTSSRDDNLDLEDHLKILNKSTIKSTQDETGRLFDCINIYEQRAFDNPLLKDLKIQMKPNFLPRGLIAKPSSQRAQSKMMLTSIDCPKGTVPIRRIQKEEEEEEEERAKDFLDSQVKDIHPTTNDQPGQHFAYIQSFIEVGKKYYGAQADMNIINPRVDDDQASFSLITIRSDPKINFNMIQAGWAVFPRLFGDHKTHLYTYWKGDKSFCHSLACPGFVQVNQNIPADTILPIPSTYNGTQQELQVLIHQDNITKDWWLQIADHAIGFWPISLFSGLTEGGTVVKFGGQSFGSTTKGAIMGFGTFPNNDLKQTGYFREMMIVNNDNTKTGLIGEWWDYIDRPKCYGVKYFVEEATSYTMAYGGPGGNCDS